MEDPAYQTEGRRPFAGLQQTSQGRASRGGCFWGFGLGCFTSLLVLVMVPFMMLAMMGRVVTDAVTNQVTTSAMEDLDLAEMVDEGKIPIQRLELNGVITGEWTSAWYTDPTSDVAVLEAIQAATKNESIMGLLIAVNSPGGSVTASDNLYHALECFKQARPGRKVIITGGDLVASGAYYLAMQADWIRVQPTSVVGSIGVIMPGINLSGLATRIGLQDNSIASGASKDIGNPLKPINPAHNAVLKTVVDGMYARFVELVAKGRKMQIEEVKKIADGRVFTAADALNLRLVDDIGYADTIEPRIAELFNCEVDDLYFYESTAEENALKVFFSTLPKAFGAGIAEALMEQPSAVPQYRW